MIIILIGLYKQLILPYAYIFFSLLFIRVTLTGGDGTLIIQTNGTEKVYDPTLPKTVNPFLAYTPNDTVSSVG